MGALYPERLRGTRKVNYIRMGGLLLKLPLGQTLRTLLTRIHIMLLPYKKIA